MTKLQHIVTNSYGREMMRVTVSYPGTEIVDLEEERNTGLVDGLRILAYAMGHDPEDITDVLGDQDGDRPGDRELREACAELRAENEQLAEAEDRLRAELDVARHEAADAAAIALDLRSRLEAAERRALEAEIRAGAPRA